MQAIDRYVEQIHPRRDGRSSERVLDAVEQSIARGRDGLVSPPLNLWRRLQARARLGFWGGAG